MNLPRHAELWLAPLLKETWRRSRSRKSPKRAWVSVVDHFEPLGMRASLDVALGRVAQWRNRWPEIADRAPRDAAGFRPQYSFFYPQEEYRRDLVDGIAEIARLGIADVEVHLHHDRDHRQSFIMKITEFCRRLAEDHGLLRQQNGRTLFGFIHGNWALDNSRPDGRWCGLPGEIALLRDLGCYADFTMPSLPSPTQSRIVNQIYWCTNNPDNSPRSFDNGIEATVGGGRCGDLLMITGPVGLRLRGRLAPRIEMGEIAGYDMPTPDRVHHWFDIAPMIGEDVFIKLHTHGADDQTLAPLLHAGLGNMYRWLAEEAALRGVEIHWATAWQMYEAANALIEGRAPIPAGSACTAGTNG